jgi:hypothetical protein
MSDWRDDSSIVNHVRKRRPRRVTTSRNWVAHFNAPCEAEVLCGGELTSYDLELADVIRAGRLIRHGEVLDEWCRCETCARMVRELAGNKEGN